MNEYQFVISSLIENGSMKYSHAGYITSIYAMYLALVNAPKNDRKPSEWVGEVGEKMTATVTIVHVGSFDSGFGLTWVYNLETEAGDKLTYFSKTDLGDKDEIVTIKFTVKEHSTYQGEKKTVITRAKAI